MDKGAEEMTKTCKKFKAEDNFPVVDISKFESLKPQKGCGKIFEYKRKGLHITGACGDTNYTDGFIPLCPECSKKNHSSQTHWKLFYKRFLLQQLYYCQLLQ